MTSQILRAVVLFSILFIKIHGRPRHQRTPKKIFSARRPVKWSTTKIARGVRLDSKDKLQVRVHPQNYLKEIDVSDTVINNGLRRKENTLDGFPQGKIQKLLFKSKPTTSRFDTEANTVQDTHSEKESVRTHLRFRRYATHSSKWNHLHMPLTWTITPGRWGTKMISSKVKDTLTKAFRAWAEVSPLVFRWVPIASLADITIEFVRGYHGCKLSFDGPRGVLAHAYFPQYGGNIHFDDEEPWKPETSNPNYKSFLKTAIHEIGHSIGLKHSHVSGAIMNPFYLSSLATRLGIDDINGVQSIYGRCEPTKIASIDSSYYNGKTYIFKDSLYWKYDDLNDQVEWPSYPRDIAKGWNGINFKIDEMLVWRYNVYFFAGKYYYRFNEYTDRVSAGPTLISQGWAGVPDDIDAAFSPDFDTSYFFKGDLCYIYNNNDDKVEKVEKISVRWPGVPDNLDTAFTWMYNGFTYFFKGRYYYEWDGAKRRANGPFRIKSRWRNICEV